MPAVLTVMVVQAHSQLLGDCNLPFKPEEYSEGPTFLHLKVQLKDVVLV